jgi:hypothetical protein
MSRRENDAIEQSMRDPMVSAYAWWSHAVGNPKAIGKTLPLHDGDPQAGFYMRPHIEAKPGSAHSKPRPEMPAEPVAIYPNADDPAKLEAVIGKTYETVNAADIWTWVCRDPIPEAEYRRLCAGGELPPKYLPLKPKAEEVKKEPEKAPEPVAVENRPVPPELKIFGIGHNRSLDEAEPIAERLKAEAKYLRELLGVEKTEDLANAKITNQETADKVGECGNRLLQIKKDAEEARVDIKAPYLEITKAIDEAFNPVKNTAADIISTCRKIVAVWKDVEAKRKREEEAKRVAEENARRQAEHEAEVAAAEKAAEEERAAAALAARQKAELAGATDEEIAAAGEKAAAEVEAKTVETPKEVKERKSASKVSVGAASGRSFAGASKRWVGVITDMEAFLIAVKDEPAIVEAAQRVANRIARDKDAEIPAGMQRKEEDA